mmetsp:Transcript_20602/g.52437  ORF Transcript_20602/g.52437 Transcript_20602/m.52437 type:complete len:220 (+) Transcript_20602:330-989(+)
MPFHLLEEHFWRRFIMEVHMWPVRGIAQTLKCQRVLKIITSRSHFEGSNRSSHRRPTFEACETISFLTLLLPTSSETVDSPMNRSAFRALKSMSVIRKVNAWVGPAGAFRSGENSLRDSLNLGVRVLFWCAVRASSRISPWSLTRAHIRYGSLRLREPPPRSTLGTSLHLRLLRAASRKIMGRQQSRAQACRQMKVHLILLRVSMRPAGTISLDLVSMV